MSSARIGALRVDLGVNSASFEKGMDAATRRINKFSGQMKKVGKSIQGVGKTLTKSISLPVAAAATAFGVAAHKIANDSREIAKSAQVAGESFEDFQRQAHAASTVGIEFEKLGDIFKDVRDRVGDFAATGGGPMADFFENIGPKVGVTAEAFKGLSGKDSLQLYYDSLKKANVGSEEMVFYLETMASDATNLIPLLEQGGKAFDELGGKANVISDEDRENLQKYTEAQAKLGQATQKLTIALVNSGVLETVTKLVDKFSEFTSNLAETNPALLRAGIVIAGVAAVLGPLLVGLGGMISVLSPLIAVLKVAFAAGGAFTAMKAGFAVLSSLMGPLTAAVGLLGKALLGLLANPIILAAAAVIAGIYLAWKHWDKIKPIIDKVARAVTDFWNEHIAPVFNYLKDKLIEAVKWWVGMHVGAIRAIAGLVNGVRTWLVNKLGAVWRTVTDKINAVKNAFFNLYDAVVGNSYIPDMVDGIALHMGRLDKAMVDPAQKATKKTGEAFRKMAGEVRSLLDELFPEAAATRAMLDDLNLLEKAQKAGVIDQSLYRKARTKVLRGNKKAPISAALLNTGPLPAAAQVNEAAKKASDAMAKQATAIQAANVRIVESFQQMTDRALRSIDRLVSGIKGGGILDIVQGLLGTLDSLGAIFTNGKGFNLFGATFGANGGPQGFANGTRFAPGGLAMVGERGPELVNLPRGSQVVPNRSLGGAASPVNITVNAQDAVLSETVKGWIAEGMTVAAKAGGDIGVNKMQRLNNRRLV